MNDTDGKQNLSAVFCADALDYDRQKGSGNLAVDQMRDKSLDLLSIQVKRHNGQVFRGAGDAVVAKFATAVAAVKCAVSFLKLLEADNRNVADDDKIQYRVGINLGNVTVDREKIHGPGLDIAARLENLADPGGICVSAPVRDSIRDSFDFDYEDMGDQHVKNIATPIRAFRLAPAGTLTKALPEIAQVVEKPKSRKYFWMVGGGILAVALAALIFQYPWDKSSTPLGSDRNLSIAVMPFTNMSDDAEQEYFSDGMTEDLITDLSKVSALIVTSRTSTFAYKGKSPDIRTVAKELNVRYVVEGSVRKIGGRIRINAQLIDAVSGDHIWAERYDREFKDVLFLQDEVRGKIVAALAVSLTPAEEKSLARPLTDSAEAYDYYLMALQYESYFTPEGNTDSRQFLEKAINLDPSFAAAYAHLAQSYSLAAELGWSDDPLGDLKKGLVLAKNAVALDDELPLAHWSLGRLYSRRSIFNGPLAISEAERAVELQPNNGNNHALLGYVLIFVGRAEEAVEHIEKAMQINSQPPYWYHIGLGMTQYFQARYEKSIQYFEKSKEQNSSVTWPYWFLASAYGHLGKIEEAKWELSELEALGDARSLEAGDNTTAMVDPTYRALFLEGLRKAGVPEK